MKTKMGTRVFYDTFENVNECMQQNIWQSEISNISKIEWKLYLLNIKNYTKSNFEISAIR